MAGDWNETRREAHLVEVTYFDGGHFIDADMTPIPAFKAAIRWDGCIHFWRLYGPGDVDEDTDYIHICDLDEMIELLQKLKDHLPEAWDDQV